MHDLVKSESKNEIVVYQPNETMRLEVAIQDDTVWLNQMQMAELFGRERSVIAKHIRNAFKEGELLPESVCAKFAQTAADGKTYQVDYFNLDVIISVGYRVKSQQGTRFRIWATQVLKAYLLNGVAVNRKYDALAFEMDRRLSKHDADIVELRKDVDYFISSSLPPKEKVFVEGKMLDAQVELTRIVKTAKRRIVLIDNYIDERTLLLLGNRHVKVSCTVYTLRPNSPKLAPALANYAKEYLALQITVKGYKKSPARLPRLGLARGSTNEAQPLALPRRGGRCPPIPARRA